LEVTTFETLHRHQGELDRNDVLPDVAIIADEADRQLEEAVGGFMVARGQRNRFPSPQGWGHVGY
jgi:hypothetical protein